MIGDKMLSWLDNRLRAGTGFQDTPFGGMSIILLGDLGQLPPVADRPLYASGSGSIMSDHGHSLSGQEKTHVQLPEASENRNLVARWASEISLSSLVSLYR